MIEPRRLSSASDDVRKLRLATGLAGLMLLLAPPHPVRAAEDGPSGDGLGTGELRKAEPDLARDFRAPPVTLAAPTFPIDPGLTDAGDAPAEAPTAEPEATEDMSPPRSRPKLDLFEGPSSGRATRQNGATTPAGPSAAPIGDTASQADGAEAGQRAAPSAPEAATGDRPDSLTLPAAASRAPRIGQVGSRLNLRTLPLRGGLTATGDEPFAPVGTRVGSFTLTSALEQSLGLSSNLDAAPGGKGGAFSDTALSARFVSDWSRHAAEIEGLANYRRNFGGDQPSDPDVALDGRLRLDIDRLTTATLRGGFEYRKENAGDLDSLSTDGESPDRFNYTSSAEIERAFGRAYARGTLAALRQTIERSDGIPRADDQDFDTYSGTLRAGYRFSPAFAPFLETGLGRRVFDEARDGAGRDRDSLIETLRGGIGFDLGEKLGGEIAAGLAHNRPDEDGADAVTSPTFDAKLSWSPRRGTDVALTAATTFDPDPAGTSTATLYEAGLAVRHRATARLALDGALTAGYRDSDLATDTEATFGISAGFSYWFNRSLALIGLASHREVERSGGNADYAVSSVKLGLKVQN
ncbi:hypothetical protein GCM10011390_12480 [Aureimonas endophytica]|uniref:Outer membrane beta-barrel protein n=1 Tax=Aureimonas endophytica TaxID=2027858 RepID=A0A916ZGQ9_9HYPH|nr:outer membrane beta-barrel protein [Aureimonas endophytica]GGD95228.1 hypothetical protein GCM10011390_12480 [Aureimonas endophytica]